MRLEDFRSKPVGKAGAGYHNLPSPARTAASVRESGRISSSQKNSPRGIDLQKDVTSVRVDDEIGSAVVQAEMPRQLQAIRRKPPQAIHRGSRRRTAPTTPTPVHLGARQGRRIDRRTEHLAADDRGAQLDFLVSSSWKVIGHRSRPRKSSMSSWAMRVGEHHLLTARFVVDRERRKHLGHHAPVAFGPEAAHRGGIVGGQGPRDGQPRFAGNPQLQRLVRGQLDVFVGIEPEDGMEASRPWITACASLRAGLRKFGSMSVGRLSATARRRYQTAEMSAKSTAVPVSRVFQPDILVPVAAQIGQQHFAGKTVAVEAEDLKAPIRPDVR